MYLLHLEQFVRLHQVQRDALGTLIRVEIMSRKIMQIG
jgi:hypothetical protein